MAWITGGISTAARPAGGRQSNGLAFNRAVNGEWEPWHAATVKLGCTVCRTTTCDTNGMRSGRSNTQGVAVGGEVLALCGGCCREDHHLPADSCLRCPNAPPMACKPIVLREYG
jgi:hypothetical protein